MENLGLIYEGLLPNSITLGAVLPDLVPSGDWEPYLPEFEKQNQYGLETMDCVQFSLLNVGETQAVYHGIPLNGSDRFFYWSSGCSENGNTYSRALNGLRNLGVPKEASWPWLRAMSRAEYGQEPPPEVKAEALQFFDTWRVGQPQYVPSNIDAFRTALKKTPLWFANEGHSMMMYRVDDRIRVFDTYPDSGMGKGSFPLDYAPQIVAAYNVPFIPKSPVPPPPVAHITLPENTYVSGIFPNGIKVALHIGGRLIVDDPGLVLSQWIARNEDAVAHRFNGGPTRTISEADWSAFERVNFKGESVE